MAEFLRGMLEISLYSAVIFCGILLFQACAKKRLSPVLRFALWFVLIARLVLPVTAETGFHFITLPAEAETSMPAAAASPDRSGSPVNAGQEDAKETAPLLPETAVQMQSRTEPKQTQTIYDPPEAAAPQRAGTAFRPEFAVFAVWICGAAAVAIVMALFRIHLGRKLKKGAILPDARTQQIFNACKKTLGIRANIRLRYCAAAGSPALTVSVRPAVLLPLSMHSEAEELLRHALLHELTHYRRKDHIVRLLMNVLRAVWWFNPVIWLADRRMLEDMETACDSMVVQRMEPTEKKRYAEAVLDLFSREQGARYVLGMALGGSRKIAEKRIRGIYMKPKTKCGVKAAALILTGILGIVCFTTACAPAQAADTQAVIEEPAAPVQQEVEPSAADTQQPAESAEAETQRSVGGYQTTGTWQETFETGNITVVADAEVLEFASGSIPDYESRPMLFSQEMVDRVTQYFMGEAQLYERGSRETGETEGVSCDGTFREMPSPLPASEDAGQCEQINVEATLADGTDASLSVYNIENMHESYLSFQKESGQETELSVSREDAAVLALETAEVLGISPAYVFGVTPSDPASGEAPRYDVILSRCPQPAVWYLHTIGSDTAYQAENGGPSDLTDMSFMYGPEVIVFGIDDSGVVSFQWSAPDAFDVAADGDAQTVPFETVLQTFRDHIGSKTWIEPELSATLYVDQVVLTMQRVLKEDGSYRTQPVWEFVGTWQQGAAEPVEAQAGAGSASSYYDGIMSLFTVNATDGTVVKTVLNYMNPGPNPQNFGGSDAAAEL